MDNQQATPTEAELAWLGGIIEGEGTLSMAPSPTGKKGENKHKIAVLVRLYNTGIISKSLEIMEKLGVHPHLSEREQKPLQVVGCDEAYKSRDSMLTLHVGLLAPAQRLLRAIQPWLFGQKSKRAEIMLNFLDRRLSMIADKAAKTVETGGGGWKVPYDVQDWKYCAEFVDISRRSTKKAFVAGVLNEYEQSTSLLT